MPKVVPATDVHAQDGRVHLCIGLHHVEEDVNQPLFVLDMDTRDASNLKARLAGAIDHALHQIAEDEARAMHEAEAELP